MLKLKLQYFGHLIQRAHSLEKSLILGKIEGMRRRGWQDEMVVWHHRLHGHDFEQTLGDTKVREAWCAAVHGVAKSWIWLSKWTTRTQELLRFWECPEFWVCLFFNVDEMMSSWVGHQENQVLAKVLELLASHSHPLTAHLHMGESTAKHGVQCDKISFCGLVSAD